MIQTKKVKKKGRVYQNHHLDYAMDYTIPLRKSHHFAVSRYFQTLKANKTNALDTVNFSISVLFEIKRMLEKEGV